MRARLPYRSFFTLIHTLGVVSSIGGKDGVVIVVLLGS